MSYSKPEVVVLGEAAVLVQGTRTQGSEVPIDGLKNPSDCEFDD
jgi:hypothetical protein